MPGGWRPSRRRLLGVLAGISGLAGCSGDQRSAGSPPTATGTPMATGSRGQPSPPETDGQPSPPATSETFDGGTIEDFANSIDRLREAGGGTLVIEAGTYRFDSMFEPSGDGNRPPHAAFEGIDDITIEGNGATVVFTNPTYAGFKFFHGHDLTIRDLTFDYDPVPFTQGTVVDLSDDGRVLDVELAEGFPTLDHAMFDEAQRVWASVHRPNGEFIRGVRKRDDFPKFFEDIASRGDRTYRLRLRDFTSAEGIREGHHLVIVARNNETVLGFRKIGRLVLENVSVHATNGAAFDAGLCEAPELRQCTVAPPRDSNRLIGADADGIRIVDCLSSATIEDCRLEYLEDDAVVVQHNLTPVTGFVDDRTVEVDEWPIYARPGDRFEAISATGVKKGSLPRVAAVTDRFEEPGPRNKVRTITFETPVREALTEGDIIGNRETASRNFVVRNNQLRNVRGNLVRIATGPGLVEGNTLEGSSFNVVEVECDSSGHFIPKGWGRDVTIRDNRIARSGLNWAASRRPAGIRVHHRPHHSLATQGRPNEDITVVGNEIERCASVGVSIEDAAGVRVRRNTMAELNRLDYPDAGYGLRLTNVRDATVADNRVEGTSGRLTGFGLRRDSEAVGAAGNEFVIDGESTSAELLRWVPVSFEFDRTVSPANSDRHLAVRIFELRLLDADGDTVLTVDVGGSEERMEIGDGVYAPEQVDGERWRWFGGPDELATVVLLNADLERAETLELDGKPITSGITAAVSVDDRLIDTVEFGTEEVSTHRIDLPG